MMTSWTGNPGRQWLNPPEPPGPAVGNLKGGWGIWCSGCGYPTDHNTRWHENRARKDEPLREGG